MSEEQTHPGIEFVATDDNQWQVNIDHGPVHHGVGSSPAIALFRAARAWDLWEQKQNARLKITKREI